MPIDINLLRQDPEKVRKSQRDRFRDEKIVDEILAIDEKWRGLRHQLDQLNKEQNKVSKAIGEKKKASKGQDPCEEEKKQAIEINK